MPEKGASVLDFLKRPLRALFYRPRGLRVGRDSFIYPPVTLVGRERIRIGERTTVLKSGYINAVTEYAGVRHNPQVVIGDDVYIGRHVYLTAIDGIWIGDGCVLSEHVYITDLFHGMDPDAGLIMNQPLVSRGPVKLGAHCFIGYRASIMPGVELGERCMVGANSVVTRSFAAYSMVAGSPARLIKSYDHVRKQWVCPSE